MARDLRRLLDLKDNAHYGIQMVSSANATEAVAWSRRLLTKAEALF